MTIGAELLDKLSLPTAWGYRPDEPPAAEPTALCGLALVGYDRLEPAIQALDELGRMQSAAGSVGLHTDEDKPHWSTAYAVLAWQAALRKLPAEHQAHARYTAAVDAGCRFLLSKEFAGKALDPAENTYIGHNTLLIGWPWIEGTHSWLEPTALGYLALKAAGRRTEPRAVEATALMVDRLLPEGGCNHGNTTVLGQFLKPHLQPSGLVMLALGGRETEGDPRVEKCLRYLETTLDDETAASSLAYALHGLAAHGRRPARADVWIDAALQKPTLDLGAGGIRRPLLALAALGEKSPLIELTRTGVPQ
jgi:hypothetical protein